MNLRILVRTYPEPTKEQCEALMEADPSIRTISSAYGKLKKQPTQDLQYRCPKDDNWYNVPVIVEEVQ